MPRAFYRHFDKDAWVTLLQDEAIQVGAACPADTCATDQAGHSKMETAAKRATVPVLRIERGLFEREHSLLRLNPH
jgi:hypothetical protein